MRAILRAMNLNLPLEVPPHEPPSVPHPEEPEHKRPRGLDYDLKWVEQLQQDAAQEANTIDIFSALQDLCVEEAFMISFDLSIDTQRQRKMIERNPVLYLTKKMNGAEVQLTKLSPEHRALFERAKTREVDSFLRNKAVRACLDNEEIKRAVDTRRIIKARWVLTWKAIAPDEREECRKRCDIKPQYFGDRRWWPKGQGEDSLVGFSTPLAP